MLVRFARGIGHGKEPEAKAATAAEAAGQETASDADAAADEPAQASETYSVSGGDGGTLSKVDGMWVWTTDDNTPYRYTEVSNDGTTIIAVLKGGGEEGKDVYLRWPNAGGTALQSYDNQDTWVEPVNVTLAS